MRPKCDKLIEFGRDRNGRTKLRNLHRMALYRYLLGNPTHLNDLTDRYKTNGIEDSRFYATAQPLLDAMSEYIGFGNWVELTEFLGL